MALFNHHRWLSSAGKIGRKFGYSALPEDEFHYLDLDGCDFSGAQMYEPEFIGCSLIGAKFVGADLQSAEFIGCNVEGADFTGANLSLSDIVCTDFSKAVGIGCARLDHVVWTLEEALSPERAAFRLNQWKLGGPFCDEGPRPLDGWHPWPPLPWHSPDHG